MPGQFAGFGIVLMYPDTWIVDQEVDGEAVSVESPEGAFLTISKCPAATAPSLALAQARAAMDQEYEQVECEAIDRQFGPLQLSGELLRFVYLDLIITSQLLLANHAGACYLVQTQAEDRDHDRLQPVFDAMLTSLCQHLASKG